MYHCDQGCICIVPRVLDLDYQAMDNDFNGSRYGSYRRRRSWHDSAFPKRTGSSWEVERVLLLI